MKRRKFAASLAGLAIVSCGRIDQRKKRYDEKECPFCSTKSGICFYCNGSGKCSFCKGTGTRVTSTKTYPGQDVEQAEYESECPYCKGSGKCRYCEGVGKCWACKGTGRIESWDFYGKYKKEQEKKHDS